MATKKSPIEAFERYHEALIFSLPMKNVKFLNDLCKHDLILEDFKHYLESLTAHKERASCFLDKIIEPEVKTGGSIYFFKLLTVMKTCGYGNVEDLAKQIEAECHKDTKLSARTESDVHRITNLEEIKTSEKLLQSTPLLKDLSNLVTPDYAAHWNIIGSLLGIENPKLQIIKHDIGSNAINCLTEVWGVWLETNGDASWKNVLDVIDHKALKQLDSIVDHSEKALWADDNFPTLGINNLMNIISLIQEKWQLIGLQLKVPEDMLGRICQEADEKKVSSDSFDTFCCTKMLSYWFKSKNDVSSDKIIEAVSAKHIHMQDKIPAIKAALASETVDSNSKVENYATKAPEAHEMPYVVMKTSVCEELNESCSNIENTLLFLRNANMDPDILKNILNFADLLRSLEKHSLMHKADLSWLKAIAKYTKCSKALDIIENYNGDSLIADKTKYSNHGPNEIKNGFAVKYFDKSLEDCTLKDCSDAKEAVSNILGLKDTDGILDSSEVGSLTFFWKVRENIKITVPKFIDASLIKKCKDVGITQIGAITNGQLKLINISELEIDKLIEDHIEKGREYLQQQYEYIVLGKTDQEEWPPYQPNVYTINILMYHKAKFVGKNALKIHKITNHNRMSINIDSCFNDDYKNVSDIFLRVETESSTKDYPKTILIEGAPGIGKTMLANQLALQWKSIHLLCNKKFLFLIYLRDPKVHQLCTVHDLLKYIFRDDVLQDYHKLINTYENFINETDGSCLALLFDGYDELSLEKRKSSFISKIINRKILKESLLIVTSRPAGSEELHCYACRRIEILGFTEEDRNIHLKNALDDSQKHEELMQYLQNNPIINTLCYNSLNMTMLVYLFKETKCLPASQVELFDMFISKTVTHFIKKSGFSGSFHTLSQFKGKYYSIVEELAKLSFSSLSKDKMVFLLSDLQNECPQYHDFRMQTKCSYGLLKEKRRLHTAESSYNFLHLTIQEYLAAWHLSNFSNFNFKKLNSIFHRYFWEHRFLNVWVLYIGITKGHSFGFKHFISGNKFWQTVLRFGARGLSQEILHDKLKCMYIFQCFKDSSNLEICRKLGKHLHDEIIDLNSHQMSPNSINTLCFILIINKQCNLKELNLSNCSIGDIGCKWFCEQFIEASSSSELFISSLNLSSNQLTTSSVNCLVELTCAIQIKNLLVCDNMFLDEEAKLLCKNCYSLEFLSLANENMTRADDTLSEFFYDPNKPQVSIAYNKESICLQKHISTLPSYVDLDFIKSLYVDYSLSSDNNLLSQLKQTLKLQKFHAIIKVNQSIKLVSLVMKMDTINELYVSQLNDETCDLLIEFLQKSNITTYALISSSTFQAKDVHNTSVVNSALQKCCIFQSVCNLIMHNCRFYVEDLIATIESKQHWNTVRLTMCAIDVDKLRYLYEHFSCLPFSISSFKLN